MTDTDVKSTPLAAKHVELGARMVPFAGWNMPVQYTGILDEHKAVRETCGIFDISHMFRQAILFIAPDFRTIRLPGRIHRHFVMP